MHDQAKTTVSSAARTADRPRGGLDGVVVAETMLSDVDGERGQLIIAGRTIEALAGAASFESVTARLWDLGNGQIAPAGASFAAEAPAFAARLGEARVWAHAQLPRVERALELDDGMDALRAALAQLDGNTGRFELTAATSVFAAAWARRQAKARALVPDPGATHAADHLRRVRGTPVTAAAARALDAYLVTVSDHGLNASTFAARVVTSTGSDDVSAVVAAVGALKGPLHGGAPGPVLDMLDAVGTPAQASAWVSAQLAAGQRIMGMGHRIYRVRDPRAVVLERALAALGDDDSRATHERLQLARAIERAAETQLAARHPDRPLKANVEFYTALLLDAVGIDRRGFSTTFAVGRVAGWLAHTAEQRRTGRLMRPASVYVGARDPLPPASALRL
jgi:citrate synthase